jgi:hypothetical protein
VIPFFNVPLAAIPSSEPVGLVTGAFGPTISFDASLAPLLVGACRWLVLFLALRSIRERQQELRTVPAASPGTSEVPAAA